MKLSAIFITVTVFILAFTASLMYQRSVLQQKEELRSRISDMARLASLLIDEDKHSQIKPQMESQGTGPYREIKEVLKNIRNIDPIIDSVYTMVKTDKEDIWMFVVDSGDRRRLSAYCGERYDVSGMPQMRLAFDGPSVDKELTVDKWGAWLSGYAPIYNGQGEAAAVVGLDVSAESVTQMQWLLSKRFLGVLIAGIIISLLMSWFIARGIVRPLRKLILGVREVGHGNLGEKIEVKSEDEIQELADAFNKMTGGLKETQAKLQRHYLDTIRSLVRAVEAKDAYTKGHSERVAGYAVNIAGRLGLSGQDTRLIEEICILHDIGKIGVPEEILTKTNALSEAEWQIIKKHPEIGREILKDIEFLRPGLSIVSDHHERPDGKGYPRGLKAEEISLLASIVAVADAFDAMTSDRTYRKAFTKDKAIMLIEENRNSQFNSRVVDAFIESQK